MALAPAQWIDIRQAASQPDPSLGLLDPGERAAILLAEEHNASLLLIDERRGRQEAQRRGLSTYGNARRASISTSPRIAKR